MIYLIAIAVGLGYLIAVYTLAWSIIEVLKPPYDGSIWTENPLTPKCFRK